MTIAPAKTKSEPSPAALRAAKRLIQSIPRASSGVIAVCNAGGYPLISDSGFATKLLADDQVGYVQEAVARVIDAETGLSELIECTRALMNATGKCSCGAHAAYFAVNQAIAFSESSLTGAGATEMPAPVATTETDEAEEVHDIWLNAVAGLCSTIGVDPKSFGWDACETTEETVGNIVGKIDERFPFRWILVSDRLPEVRAVVLVAIGPSVIVGRYEGDGRFHDEQFGGWCRPTHWQSLPAPPKE